MILDSLTQSILNYRQSMTNVLSNTQIFALSDKLFYNENTRELRFTLIKNQIRYLID